MVFKMFWSARKQIKKTKETTTKNTWAVKARSRPSLAACEREAGARPALFRGLGPKWAAIFLDRKTKKNERRY